MARNGWLKLWYKIEDNPISQDVVVLGLFTKLLLLASRKESTLLDGTIIERGQVVVSQRALAKAVNIGHKRLRNAFQTLHRRGIIELKTAHTRAHAPTIVTICKYDTYQTRIQPEGTPEGTEGAQVGHSEGTEGALLVDSKSVRSKESEELKTVSKETASGYGPMFVCKDVHPAYLTEFEYKTIQASVGVDTDEHLLKIAAACVKKPHPWRCNRANLSTNIIEKWKKNGHATGCYSEEFKAWWAAYPAVGRVEPREAFVEFKAATQSVPLDTLMAATAVYAASPLARDGRWVKHAATWLNKGCWGDDVEAWKAVDVKPAQMSEEESRRAASQKRMAEARAEQAERAAKGDDWV